MTQRHHPMDRLSPNFSTTKLKWPLASEDEQHGPSPLIDGEPEQQQFFVSRGSSSCYDIGQIKMEVIAATSRRNNSCDKYLDMVAVCFKEEQAMGIKNTVCMKFLKSKDPSDGSVQACLLNCRLLMII